MNYKFAMSATNQFYLCPIENVVNRSQKNKINQQLLDACKSGNFQKVRELIEYHGADLHLASMEKCLTFNPEGNNPLHLAAAKGYNDIVEYLINHNTSYSQFLCTRKFSLGGNSLIH